MITLEFIIPKKSIHPFWPIQTGNPGGDFHFIDTTFTHIPQIGHAIDIIQFIDDDPLAKEFFTEEEQEIIAKTPWEVKVVFWIRRNGFTLPTVLIEPIHE